MLNHLINRKRHARYGEDKPGHSDKVHSVEESNGHETETGGHRGRGGKRAEGRGHHGHKHGGRGHQMKLRRLFEHGDLRVVLLALVAKKPSYGYELIKAIEEAASGLYTPSPGVIYPTLSLLEEQGHIEAIELEKGRKSFQITAEGQEQLKANQTTVDAIFQRLTRAGKGHNENLASEIEEAIHNLKGLLRHNLIRRELSPEQISRIATTLNDAVVRIQAELQTESNDA